MGIATVDVNLRWIDVFVLVGETGEYDNFVVNAGSFAEFLDRKKKLESASEDEMTRVVSRYLSGGEYAGKDVTVLQAVAKSDTGPEIDTLALTVRVAA
jgi:hypothetical protein